MLRGRQRPRIEHVPASPSSAGDDAIDFAAEFGLHLDPWQQHVVRGALGERADGSWQSFEVGLIVPRQNGKGAILEALELFWLFLCDDDRLILHSAHEFKTAREAFLRIRGLIEASAEYRPLVRQFYASTGGECGIELTDGKRLRFVARSSGAGRGFSPDKLVLDEAYNLPDTTIEAVLPSVGARPNPQVWYTSSPGDVNIAPCDVLARVRRRGIAAEDERLSYFEWSVPYNDAGEVEGDPHDRRLWAMANPSLGIRKTEERIENFANSMSPAGFAREELGVGTWPLDVDAGVFSAGAWTECRDEAAEPVVFAVGAAVSYDRSHSSICAAGLRGDVVVVGVADRRPGTDWLVAELYRLQAEYGCMVVVDEVGPTSNLIPSMRDAGLNVTTLNTPQVANAFASFVERVEGRKLAHPGHIDLDQAVAVAAKREIGDGRWTWARRKSGGDIAILEAATNATWVATTTGVPTVW